MSSKTASDGLDAKFIISQASKRNRESVQDEPIAAPVAVGDADEETAPTTLKEESRRRKTRGQDYENLFIHDAPASTRSGKTVYIRAEFHERITKIVRVIGGNELSLFSYLDNVLEHHFNTYQDDIEELYDKRNSGVFRKRNQ